MKRCNVCNEEKPFEDFYRKGSYKGKTYYKAECKACFRAPEQKRSVVSTMISAAKRRAKQKGWDFDLDIEFIVALNESQGGKCFYTGWELNWDRLWTGKKRTCPPTRASIDRIDSSKGYTRDNVVLACDAANRIKSAYSQELFFDICSAVHLNRNQ